MILGNRTIIEEQRMGRLHISPFNLEQVGPNSYDVRLGNLLKKVLPNDVLDDNTPFINPEKPQNTESIKIPRQGVVIEPLKLYLGHTMEEVGSDDYVPMYAGRSSIGRMGLFSEISAAFGDVGFDKQWTLEIFSANYFRLIPGMCIGQVYFESVTDNAVTYKSRGRYSQQAGPQESLFWKR
jgi:dCTP deaminase